MGRGRGRAGASLRLRLATGETGHGAGEERASRRAGGLRIGARDTGHGKSAAATNLEEGRAPARPLLHSGFDGQERRRRRGALHKAIGARASPVPRVPCPVSTAPCPMPPAPCPAA